MPDPQCALTRRRASRRYIFEFSRAGYVPKNTNDEENWNSKKAMNLMFSIGLPKAPGGVSVNINMTKLRLYKHFIACTSQSSVEVRVHFGPRY